MTTRHMRTVYIRLIFHIHIFSYIHIVISSSIHHTFVYIIVLHKDKHICMLYIACFVFLSSTFYSTYLSNFSTLLLLTIAVLLFQASLASPHLLLVSRTFSVSSSVAFEDIRDNSAHIALLYTRETQHEVYNFSAVSGVCES